jgi:hypothetical protein
MTSIVIVVYLSRKRLRGRIYSSYPSLPQASLDELLPSKYTLASIRVFTHGNSNVTIFIVDDQPLFFDYEDYFCPTGMKNCGMHFVVPAHGYVLSFSALS